MSKPMEAKTAVKVWTLIKGSFLTFGTPRMEVIAAEVVPEQTINVAGFTLHVVKNPKKGGYHIAEGETGAFVGYGRTDAQVINQVTSDLLEADATIIAQQMKRARKQATQAQLLSPEEFWSKF